MNTFCYVGGIFYRVCVIADPYTLKASMIKWALGQLKRMQERLGKMLYIIFIFRRTHCRTIVETRDVLFVSDFLSECMPI